MDTHSTRAFAPVTSAAPLQRDALVPVASDGILFFRPVLPELEEETKIKLGDGREFRRPAKLLAELQSCERSGKPTRVLVVFVRAC